MRIRHLALCLVALLLALTRIFEPFVTTKSQGLGMGLAISRSIIEAHSGRIWATANEDHGLTVHVDLPA